MKYSIMVIDDEVDFLDSVRRGLITAGFKNIHTEANPDQATADIQRGEISDIALIDITMPGMDGIELLDTIKQFSPRTECIMITAVDEARVAVECLKKGAYDYLVKPISKEELISSINRALERKRLLDIVDLGKRKSAPKLNNPQAFAAIVTANKEMVKILKEAELHAASKAPILITGETGTGKELLARAIHAASARSQNIFTPINMDALSSSLFDAEFFGHTKGAFTGAEKERAGYLETTHKGTLFLDEIGNLPLELQGKLLRVLQDGEYFKIGNSRPSNSDVRVIAATNKDLDGLMAKNQFRNDLYYRLSGSWLHLPALRERRDDIPLLVGHFLKNICDPEACELEEEAMSILMAYDYPGNIRELKSIIQSAVNLAQGENITVRHLPPHLPKKVRNANHDDFPPESVPTLAELDKRHILKVYRMTGQNKAESARVLDIGVNTLRRKLDSYGVR